jgi:hypothetical protein
MKIIPFTILAPFVLATSAYSAATLTHIASPDLGRDEINISVFDGKAAYDGNGGEGVMGGGTATDYRLFRDSGDLITDPIETFASKGSRIGDITKTGTYSFNRRDYLDFWTTTDPGTLTAGIPAFSSAANYDFSLDGEHTAIGFGSNVSGSINISGLASGSLYLFIGTFNDGYTVTLTMSGAGQTDVTDNVVLNGGIPNQSTIDGYWVSEFNFADNAAGDYTSISYDISGINGHFAGVVLAVPEPSTTALLGSFGVLMLLRRRR